MLLNAAAALLVAGRANDLGDGVALARATLDSGDARRKLADFTAATHAVCANTARQITGSNPKP